MSRATQAVAALALCSALACHRAPTAPGAAARKETPAKLPEGLIRFAVIGDFGTGDADELEVARMVSSWSPSFIVTVGDNNHPNGSAADLEPHVAAAYGQYIPGDHGAYGIGSASPRFFPSLGNHDWRSSTGLQPYIDFFHTPGNGRYYETSLEGGRIALFALDSDPHEPDGMDPDSKQAQWLRSRAAASSACLRIAAFHHPPYSSALHGSTKAMRWPFRAMGLDAVLAGHDHTYERLEIDGIPYFVDGLGGAGIYPFGSALPESRVRYNDAHGAMLVTLSPTDVRYEMWSVAGEKVDSLTVAKACPLAAAHEMDLRTLARAYDRSAASYDERFRALQRPKYRAAAQLLEQAGFAARPLAPDALVLDAGAGTGLFVEWLRDEAEPHREVRARLLEVVSRGRFLALDASVEMLRCARPRTRALACADSARPPLPDASCALVLSFTALLENVPASLRALAALVEPRGLLCVSFLARESPAPEQLERWCRLSPTLPSLAAGQDLVHLVGQPLQGVQEG